MCLKKWDRHTWYISPHHVVFALWSARVSEDVKEEMAQRLCGHLKIYSKDETERRVKEEDE